MPTRPIYHVRMWQITHNINMLDHYIAADRGFYADQGLEVETIIGTEGPASDPSRIVCDGETHFGIAGPMNFQTALRESLPLRWVLYTRLDPPHRLIGRPGIRTAQDLKGKLVGIVASRGLYYFLIRRWLEENGVNPDTDVRFLERDPEALRDFNVTRSPWARQAYMGAADAFVIDEIKLDLYEAIGFSSLVEPYERYPRSSVHGLATTQEMTEEHPDVVRRMIQAHINVARFIQNDPMGTTRYIAERWNVSEAVAAKAYERMRPVFIADVSPGHLDEEMRFLKGMKEIAPFPAIEPEQWIEPRFAEGLQPALR